MKSKIKLALIYGGKGLERDISVKGAENFIRHVDDDLFTVIPVFIAPDGRWMTIKKNGTSIVRRLPSEGELTETASPINLGNRGALITQDGELVEIDAAFPLLHGDYGEDGTVQGALESAGIPLIGCETSASALCCDKIYTKAIAEHLEIPTAKWIAAIGMSTREAQSKAESKIGFPLFIKPARLGSSFGAAAVRRGKDFADSYENAARLGSGRVLIERLVETDAELECVGYTQKSKLIFTKIGCIRYNADFYDYDTKYNGAGTTTVGISDELESKYGDILRSYSKKLADFIGIRGLCRFDFFLDRCGNLLFNEINTMPGFTESSLCPTLIGDDSGELVKALSEIIVSSVGEKR